MRHCKKSFRSVLVVVLIWIVISSMNVSVFAEVELSDVLPDDIESNVDTSARISSAGLDEIEDLYDRNYSRLYSRMIGNIEFNYYKYNDRALLQSLYDELYTNKTDSVDDYILTEEEFELFTSYIISEELEAAFPALLANGIKQINFVDMISYDADSSYDGVAYLELAIIEIPTFVVMNINGKLEMTSKNDIKHCVSLLEKYVSRIEDFHSYYIDFDVYKTIYHEIGHLAHKYYDDIYKQVYFMSDSPIERYMGVTDAMEIHKLYGNYYHQPVEIIAETFVEILGIVHPLSWFNSMSGNKNLEDTSYEYEVYYYDDSSNNRLYNFMTSVEDYIRIGDESLLIEVDQTYVYDPYSKFEEKHFTSSLENRIEELPFLSKSLAKGISRDYKEIVEYNDNTVDDLSLIIAHEYNDTYSVYEQDMFEYIKDLRNAKNLEELTKFIIGYRDGNGYIHNNSRYINKLYLDYNTVDESLIKSGIMETVQESYDKSFDNVTIKILNNLTLSSLNNFNPRELVKEEVEVMETLSNDEALQRCVDLGMIKGSGGTIDSSYGSTSVSRLQLGIMLLRLLGLEEEASIYVGGQFTDVNESTIPWANGRNITSYLHDHPELGFGGYPDGTFKSNGQVNGQVALKVILTILEYEYGVDYTWSGVKDFANSIDLREMDQVYSENIKINNLVQLTVKVLHSKVNNKQITLGDQLGIE